jgi:hypothetical protein
LDARHRLLFRVSFGLFPDGAEAGRVRWVVRDPALITPPRRRAPTPPPPSPLAPRAAGRGAARSGPGRPGRAGSSPPPPPLAPYAAGRGADRLGPVRPGRAGHHLRHRPQPPVRPGGAPCALPLPAGVGRCPLAYRRGCLLGRPSARRIAGTRPSRHRCPRKGQQWGGARAGAAAGGSPSAPFRGLRARGAGPFTGTSAGLECCVHRIASRVRLRRLGLHRVGRRLDTVPPSRLGPAGRSSWAARPFGGAAARCAGGLGSGRLLAGQAKQWTRDAIPERVVRALPLEGLGLLHES